MASSVVGESGRVYAQGEVLQRHREDHALSIFKAKYVQSFVHCCRTWAVFTSLEQVR